MTQTETRPLSGPSRGAAEDAASALVVLLHGYGANGDDLFALADPLARILPHAAFSAPNAPERCPMNPMGFQWFPIPWIDGSSEAAMRAGFERAEEDLDAFLDAELARLSLTADRLALIGFSQGAMMSLQVAPRRQPALAGVIGFSGRLADASRLAEEARSKPPVLLVHGDRDDVIPVGALEEARRGLAAADLPVRWHVSQGVGHGIAPDGVELAAEFLREVLPQAR